VQVHRNMQGAAFGPGRLLDGRNAAGDQGRMMTACLHLHPATRALAFMAAFLIPPFRRDVAARGAAYVALFLIVSPPVGTRERRWRGDLRRGAELVRVGELAPPLYLAILLLVMYAGRTRSAALGGRTQRSLLAPLSLPSFSLASVSLRPFRTRQPSTGR
jgi:hypothetical protein